MEDKSLEQIIQDLTAQEEKKPKALTEKPKIVAAPKARESDNPPSPNNNNHDSDFLSLLKNELIAAPFLSIAEQYAKRTSLRNRSVNSCMFEFKQEHKNIYTLLLFLDIIMKIIYLIIIIIVVLRGLGLLDLIVKTRI